MVCLTAGSYAGLVLAGTHSRNVIVQPVPGAHVVINTGATNGVGGEPVGVEVRPDTNHVIVHGFWITNSVVIEHGDKGIRIDHNDITGGDTGIGMASWNCSAPNAPAWSGCQSVAPAIDITISGNRIHGMGSGGSSDAINVDNFRNLRVTGNEEFGNLETGNHTDCFQATFGGTNITFDHNYEHDNQCQGFFIKDGDVTNATVADNLFVRDEARHATEENIQIFDTHNVVIRNNTSWTGQGDILRNVGARVSPTATVDHNVIGGFNNGCCGEGRFTVTEAYNMFGDRPGGLSLNRTDRISHRPHWKDAAKDDYRLGSNPHNIGIDWSPADQQYGPES